MDKTRNNDGFDYGLLRKICEWTDAGQLKMGEIVTLFMLARRRNSKSGLCNPSISKLVEQTGGQVSDRTFIRAIETLSDKGLVKVVKSRTKDGYKQNNYEFPQLTICHKDQLTICQNPTDNLSKPNCQIVTLTREREQEKVNKSVCVEQHTLREIDLESEIQALASKGVPRSFSRHCIERWNADGGKACKVPVTKNNFVNRVEAWWGTEHHQERYLDQQPAVTQKPIPCSWELCEERCANFQGGRCICGMKVSPESNPSRPYPPNECPRFKDITERECA